MTVNRRLAGWTALAAGLLTVAGGVRLGVESSRPPAAVGPPPALRLSTPSEAAPGPVSGPVPGNRSGKSAPAWAVPTRVTIGALRVDAPVDPAGVRPDRSLAVPEDPDRLGWWIGSAAPGTPKGTVLLAGHVDTARDGAGALFRLERLSMGARIDVRAGDRVITYRAVARRSYVKQRLPADLYRTDSSPRLVLITCGGTFHNGVYSHNVVVYAEPLGTGNM
ncbi:class F sortase [Actinoplanes sp. NPDC051470]|uniref:class F sortase n=1 Tax=Actinoplanes sp. NPDC051470 TaxID=3157224 RepID=UPI00343BD772